MSENVLMMEQGSKEWFEARLGCVTASRVIAALSFLKRSGESSAAREDYKIDLVTEILSHKPVTHYVSPAMLYGIENEHWALEAYELRSGSKVEHNEPTGKVDAADEIIRVGFVKHPAIERAGASPDGMVGEDGLVELKVPEPRTHIRYVLGGVVPPKYIPQMMWQMACTGRKWNDFVSYDPRMIDGPDLFIVRLERNDEIIAEMEKQVIRFCGEVDDLVSRLRKPMTLEDQLRISLEAQARSMGPETASLPEL